MLELEITPNRPDCMSVAGVAREVGAVLGVPASVPASTAAEVGEPAGVAPAAAPALSIPESTDMTFADSSTRLLSESEVAMLGPTTLRFARNEIFARKGRRFKDPILQSHFNQYTWYQGRYDEVRLNPIEQRNVELLRRAEARFGGGSL